MRRLTLVLFALLAACDSPTAPGPPMLGRYALVSVEGKPLPVDVSWTDSFGVRNERHLVVGLIHVDSIGKFTETRRYKGQLGYSDLTVRGQWSGEPDALTMRGFSGVPFKATRTATGLDCEHPDGLYRYVYQGPPE
jgi:hypothetical protein